MKFSDEIEEKYSKSTLLGGARSAPPKKSTTRLLFEYFSSISLGSGNGTVTTRVLGRSTFGLLSGPLLPSLGQQSCGVFGGTNLRVARPARAPGIGETRKHTPDTKNIRFYHFPGIGKRSKTHTHDTNLTGLRPRSDRKPVKSYPAYHF